MVAETKLYDALSVSPTASQDEIKKAYRYAPQPAHNLASSLPIEEHLLT